MARRRQATPRAIVDEEERCQTLFKAGPHDDAFFNSPYRLLDAVSTYETATDTNPDDSLVLLKARNIAAEIFDLKGDEPSARDALAGGERVHSLMSATKK